MGAGWSNERDLVFTLPDGRPLDPESVAKVFDRWVARSGLPRFRFHDLRLTHIAHLIAAGEQPHWSPGGLVTRRARSRWTAADTCSSRPVHRPLERSQRWSTAQL
jgi:integrase